MTEPQEQDLEDIPESKAARWAWRSSLIPFFGIPLFIILSFVALYQIGNIGRTGLWLLKRGVYASIINIIIFAFCFWLQIGQHGSKYICNQCGMMKDVDSYESFFFDIIIPYDSKIIHTDLSKDIVENGVYQNHPHNWIFAHGGGYGCSLGYGSALYHVVYYKDGGASNTVKLTKIILKHIYNKNDARDWVRLILNTNMQEFEYTRFYDELGLNDNISSDVTLFNNWWNANRDRIMGQIRQMPRIVN